MSDTNINEQMTSSRAFLDEVYTCLGYTEGVLLPATSHPTVETVDEWLEKGDWLTLAEQVGAEKVFFVNNDPIIVFCEVHDTPHSESVLRILRRAWCMARPPCIFLAFPGELRVYSLNQHPPANQAQLRNFQSLDVVKRVADVATELQAYYRGKVESGQLFAESRFGSAEGRADRQLIQDLKVVRKRLRAAGLDGPHLKYAHALIGRSIFIRYLEDRGILIPAYFDEVAEGNPKWQNLLATPPEKPEVVQTKEKRRYDRVLRNHAFTYALFDKLAEDFNGDMFPQDDSERTIVSDTHLEILRSFLLGDTDPNQERLFFWAYDFEIVPIELISSIYEEFYQTTNDTDKATHYTPSVLAEYVTSQLLIPERLATTPRILDPACGSGIFLVEAFRRIVRYHMQKYGRLPDASELRAILRNQICGIEINPEAAQITAFSLYLALLHYQEPPDILRSPQLPNLVSKENHPQDDQHYNIIHNTNTFAPTDEERVNFMRRLANQLRFDGRIEIERLRDSPISLPLALHTFDLIIGNPPWGALSANEKQAERWWKAYEWPIGDREQSQAFIARSLSLLKPGGEAGLLVSTGVLFKRQSESLLFRRRWLAESTLKTVVSFVHVRNAFFRAAVPPFAFIHYALVPPAPEHRVNYWSVKKTAVVDKMPVVVLSLPDIHRVAQQDLRDNDNLWKVYWWGNHRDAALIKVLDLNKRMRDLIMQRAWPQPKWGFQGSRPGTKNKASGWLTKYKELPASKFSRYGQVRLSDLQPVPSEVSVHSDETLYSGWRMLIGRGPTQAGGANGRIEVRLDDIPYSFRNSVIAVKLDNAEDWERKIILAIMWSSLTRYYLFLTSSSWGSWHHQLYIDDILSLPLLFPENTELREKIVSIVDRLRESEFTDDLLLKSSNLNTQVLEQRLDELIFDLYELNEAERDLIRDMCDYGLPFFYDPLNSAASKPVPPFPTENQGTIHSLRGNHQEEQGLEGYLYAFLQIWNRELEPDGEFRWRIIRPRHIPMLAVVFSTQQKDQSLPRLTESDEVAWRHILEQYNEVHITPISRSVYIEGMVRITTDTDIIIIKRDEYRLWTRSSAREDAEATLLQAIQLQESTQI